MRIWAGELKETRVQVLESIAEAVGNTPMVRMSRLCAGLKHLVLAKCEFMNPGGSVKDRIAFYMVEQAEKEGRLRPGQLIVEATGGNTGIGLAMAARLKGYKLKTVMTEKVGKEKVELMKILGAETVVVPGGKSIDDPEHFINKARTIAQQEGAWYVDQFANEHNLHAHYKYTGPEIWEQTNGSVDVLVAGIGTGGTLCGAGKYLKERKPSVQLVLADPDGSQLSAFKRGASSDSAPYLVEGIGGDFIPAIVSLDIVDHCIQVSDQESIQAAHDLLAKEAILAGSSSGCVVAAAIKFCANQSGEGLTVVAILPDTGRLYFSTIYDDDWLASHLAT
jgi:cystathionine beta-synthase